jgi:glycosyltransferase involved in cell wall biosynthesis
VARLVPLKNLGLLLEAVALVGERVPATHLILVGDGPEADALRARAATLGIGNRVTFMGYVPQNETPALYRTADVFALSSDFDNSPNAVLEAMACGLPVVTTDVGGVREFVIDGVGGLVVPPNAAADMASALEKYLISADAAHAAGSRNCAKAVAEFSWRVSARRLMDVYQQVIESRRSNAEVAEHPEKSPSTARPATKARKPETKELHFALHHLLRPVQDTRERFRPRSASGVGVGVGPHAI